MNMRTKIFSLVASGDTAKGVTATQVARKCGTTRRNAQMHLHNLSIEGRIERRWLYNFKAPPSVPVGQYFYFPGTGLPIKPGF